MASLHCYPHHVLLTIVVVTAAGLVSTDFIAPAWQACGHARNWPSTAYPVLTR